MSLTSTAAVAGVASTVIFVGSTLPMLGKAVRTRDLRSYSLGNLGLANAGNMIHSVYVFSLPPGPLWALHLFNLGSTLFMLVWFLRFGGARMHRKRAFPTAAPVPTLASGKVSPTAERSS